MPPRLCEAACERPRAAVPLLHACSQPGTGCGAGVGSKRAPAKGTGTYHVATRQSPTVALAFRPARGAQCGSFAEERRESLRRRGPDCGLAPRIFCAHCDAGARTACDIGVAWDRHSTVAASRCDAGGYRNSAGPFPSCDVAGSSARRPHAEPRGIAQGAGD